MQATSQTHAERRFRIGAVAPGGALALCLLVLPAPSAFAADTGAAAVFRAGAAAIDITPRELPVRVSGSFLEHSTSQVKDRLHARCLVLDDGRERVAIATVDNCVIPQDVFDAAKKLAHEVTGIPTDRMLMSATHTHSGPALDPLLGSDGNPQYRQWLPGRIAESVQGALRNLAPARIGWGVVSVPELTHCRQWIRRPDRIDLDPFGRQTVRSMMHPGYQNPDYLGPAGPVDPELSLVAVQSRGGRPIAVLANYSMHYVGAEPLSADYFGAFGDKFAAQIGIDHTDPPFVGMMSNGTSGDLHWMDYNRPKPAQAPTHLQYAELIAKHAVRAYSDIRYSDHVPLAMRETVLALENRPISDADLDAARRLFETFKERQPKTLPEVYALEQLRMSERPSRHELKLQALQIGDLGIAAIPCEVFGITGLQIKALSPLTPTFTIELANGYHGYIPPPAQHPLGGYTTWRARSACLEVDAAPKITRAIVKLLEEVSGRPRRTLTDNDYGMTRYAETVLASKPTAYWRLNDFEGPTASDASGNNVAATFEPGVVFYLEGPKGERDDTRRPNRAPHFAGGRLVADIPGLGDAYTVELWFSNFLPTDARAVTGYLLARGAIGDDGRADQLAIAGKGSAEGRLIFCRGASTENCMEGRTPIATKKWQRVTLVRDGPRLTVYLDGEPQAEISGQVGDPASGGQRLFIGGRGDGTARFEGRIDEVAVYTRALTPQELTRHLQAAPKID